MSCHRDSKCTKIRPDFEQKVFTPLRQDVGNYVNSYDVRQMAPNTENSTNTISAAKNLNNFSTIYKLHFFLHFVFIVFLNI